MSSEEDPATATVNMYRIFRDVWTYGSWDKRADRQSDQDTDGQTDMLIAIRHTLTEDKVKIFKQV